MFLGVIVAILSVVYSTSFCDALKTANGCSYEYVGCYKDKFANDKRAYDNLYKSYRGSIPWSKPCSDFTPIVDGCCDVLMSTNPNNYMFGVQYYGECWTYKNNLAKDYSKYGTSDKCVLRNCLGTNDMIGKGYTNGIYCAYECGKKKSEPRIVNGELVENHYPFLASLQMGARGNHFCGATLISCRWLLTAAHCFKFSPGGGELEALPNEYAELGHKHLGEGTIYKYDKIYIHPKYTSRFAPAGLVQFDYDVALLRLTEIPSIDGTNIQPVCLDDDDVLGGDSPTNSNWIGNSYTVAGWGNTKNAYGSPSLDLRSVKTPQVSRLKCPGIWSPRKACFTTGPALPLPQTPQQGRGTCSGDAGGPYFYVKNGKYVQAAIVSSVSVFTSGGVDYCAEPETTHEGTKVDDPEIKSWIEETCRENNNVE